MARKNSPRRVYSKLIEDMERIIGTRVKLGLMNYKDAKMPKVTELLTRTDGYKQSLEELRTKPEKKKNDI